MLSPHGTKLYVVPLPPQGVKDTWLAPANPEHPSLVTSYEVHVTAGGGVGGLTGDGVIGAGVGGGVATGDGVTGDGVAAGGE